MGQLCRLLEAISFLSETGVPGGPGAEGAWDLISMSWNLSATMREIGGRGRRGTRPVEGPLQGSKFKVVGTRMAAVETARRSWILGLSEGREDMESSIKAERRSRGCR